MQRSNVPVLGEKKIYIYAKNALTSGTKHSLWVQFPFRAVCAKQHQQEKYVYVERNAASGALL